MMEDTANKSVIDVLKMLFRKGLGAGFNFVKNKVKRTAEPHKMRSLRKLARKNPGQGVNTEILESKEMSAYVEKHLKKFDVDYYAKYNKKNNTYTISTTKNNKDLVDIFQKEFKEKQAARAVSRTNRTDKGRKYHPLNRSIALAEKAANYTKQHEVHKHRELGSSKENRAL